MHSLTKDDPVIAFASAAIAALLSEQMCILLLLRFCQEEFCTPKDSHHFDRKYGGKAAHGYAFPIVIYIYLSQSSLVLLTLFLCVSLERFLVNYHLLTF
jgi:hypothetical protein